MRRRRRALEVREDLRNDLGRLDARESGKTLYSADWASLKGLVTSGRDHLRRIADENR